MDEKVENIVENLEQELSDFQSEDIETFLSEETIKTYLDDSTKLYIKEISKYPLLSDEEQQRLLTEYKKTGNEEIFKRLVNSNLRLSVFVAKKYIKYCKSMTFLDLIQECNVGLMDAINLFDPSVGIKLSTYAVTAMNRNVMREIDNKDKTIRKSVHFESTYSKYRKFSREYFNKYNDYPSREEIKKALNISDEIIDYLLNYQNYEVDSLDRKIKEDDSDAELGSFISSENNNFKESENFFDEQIIKKALKDYLSPKEYYLYYYRVLTDKKSLEKIGEEFKLTRERIRQIEAKVNKKLKPIYKKLIQNTTNKYSLKQLSEMDLTPVSPKIIAYFYGLKNWLDEIKYFVLYTKYFTPKNNNVIYYRKKFPYLNVEEIENIISDIDNKYSFFSSKEIDTMYESFLKNHTISQIFDLDIKPNISVKYQDTFNFSENITFEEIVNNPNYRELDSSSKELIRRYFYVPKYDYQYQKIFDSIERNINMYLLGFYKNCELPLTQSEIRKILNDHGEKFSDKVKKLIAYYFLNEKDLINTEEIKKEKKNILYYRNKLLRYKYHTVNFFSNEIYLEYIEKVLEKYPNILTSEEIEILMKYYKDQVSLTDLAEYYNEEYARFHDRVRNLRIKVLNKYYGLGWQDKDITEDKFILYLNDPRYEFSDDSRNILKMYIEDHLNYEEISNQTGYSKLQVSNFITEGIRRLNFYYYGILTPFVVDIEKFKEYLETLNYGEEEKEMLYKKFILNKEITEIAVEHNKGYTKLSSFIDSFYYQYLSSFAGDITIQDYKEEIDRHISESVLTEEEKKLVSLNEGIVSVYNPTGTKYTAVEIYEIMGISACAYNFRRKIIENKMREKVLGFRKPEFGILPREEVKKALEDVNIPLSEKEKEILSHLCEINGYVYMNNVLLAKKYNITKHSLKRRYQRSILTIMQYQQNKIKAKISFENDIVPILKYFSLYDEKIVRMIYEENLKLPEITKRLDVTLSNAQEIVARLQLNVAEILNNSKSAKTFDFEYARSVINEPDLPIGDSSKKDLYILIYKMLTGEDGEHKYSAAEIKKILNLELHIQTIPKIMYKVMLAVDKYKIGIRSNEIYNKTQIEEFYLNHKEQLLKTDLILFERYLSKKQIFADYIPVEIIYLMLKSEGKLVFKLEDQPLSEIKKYLFDKSINIPSYTRKWIQTYYQIPERELMTGKEKVKVMKLLESMYLKRQQTNEKSVKLSL